MAQVTPRQRIARMFEHRQADRVPIMDYPWRATVQRWKREGMPEGVDWIDYFGVDRIGYIGADNSPRYPQKTIEETDEHVVYTSQWGATLKQWKHAASTPEFLHFTTVDPQTWKEAKARMTPDRERIDWKALERDYPKWKEQDLWIEAGFWFGFDVTHSWSVGTERVLFALVENPEWCVDMFNTYLDLDIALFDMVWDAGYRFDSICWPDDMGYKQNQFFSLDMYRELLRPVHQRAVEWAHAKGLKARLHSCGDIRPFIPDLIDIGIDSLNPLEVKAGVDPVKVKQQYGDKLVLHGGINAVLWDNLDAIEAEMRRVVPKLKERGGYIFGSDHSIPSSVSLEGFKRIVALAKELGSYE